MRRALAVLAAAAALVAARDAAADCQGRPTDTQGFQGYSYGAATVKSYAGANVLVHYATSGEHAPDLTSTRPDGVPDNVAYAADRGDEALAAYAGMGFNAIPSDAACASNGGDGKVDIYLVAFAGADGATYAECPSGTPCSSFVLVESKFIDRGYANAQEGFRTVVTHELFHAEQNTYRLDDGLYWREGTAQWAMHQVHPELPDFVNQMPDFFADPSRSIDTPPAGLTTSFQYGSAVWPLFLSLHYDVGVIHDVFVAETKTTDESMLVIDSVLKAQGSSLAAAFPLFGAWNVGTKNIASAGGYPDAATYPGIKPAALADGVTAITSGFGYFAYRGTLTATEQISLDTDATRNAGVVVPVTNGVMQLAQAQALPASVDGDVIVVVSGITSKKTDAPFTLHIGAAATPVDSGVRPPATVVGTTSGGCAAASAPGAAANLGALMIVFGVVALRSRRKS